MARAPARSARRPGARGSLRLVAALAIGLAAAGLGGCGFRPLYGDQSAGSTGASLANIRISQIANREGQQLRNSLLQRMTPRGTPIGAKWRLDVSLTTSGENVGILQDNSVTRVNYRIDASYALVDVATGKTAVVRSARSIVSYNVASSEYAAVVSQRDAEKRAIEEVADEIHTRLAVYFDQVALGQANP